MTLALLQTQPALIDQVHDRLLAAVVDGTLAPGRRLTQEELALMLGVSRQPVSHALQVLRRKGLFVDAGKRGVAVAPIDGQRIRDLYQVREALDGLAAELAAARVRSGTAAKAELAEAQAALAAGSDLVAGGSMARLVDADVAFHSAIHRLSGNPAIAETVTEQWPHFRRSMRFVLETTGHGRRIWREHEAILAAIAAGDSAEAGRLSREHARRAADDTAGRLDMTSNQKPNLGERS